MLRKMMDFDFDQYVFEYLLLLIIRNDSGSKMSPLILWGQSLRIMIIQRIGRILFFFLNKSK